MPRALRWRAKWLQGLLLLPAFAAATPAIGPSKALPQDRLAEVNGLRVLRLWGEPAQRGYAHGYLLAADIVALLDRYLSGGELGGLVTYQTLVLPMTNKVMLFAPRKVYRRSPIDKIRSAVAASPYSLPKKNFNIIVGKSSRIRATGREREKIHLVRT